MRPFTHPILRRSILALAIAHLVVCSLAPLHDLGTNVDQGAARVERAHTPTGVPVHNPDTCPVCQLMNAQLVRPDETRITPSTGSVQRPASVATAMPVARAPPTAHQTRAPPLPLV